MKIKTKYLILGLLIGFFMFPIIGGTAKIEPTQAERRFRIGLTAAASENWDDAITDGYGATDLWIAPGCTESLSVGNYEYDAGLSEGVDKAETWVPVLATSWEIDRWPEEMNDQGFVNRGGVENITYTLREGVTFHDGSAWNATVAKWNIDRLFITTGNLTGNGDLRNRDSFWVDVADFDGYFTDSWNLSAYIGQYGWYDTWNPWTYQNPWGGFDAGGQPIHYAPYEKYPIVRRVVITNDQASGGQIRIEFNDWNMYYTRATGLIQYISMAEYGDYWDRGIYGFDNDQQDPRNPTQVDHMIGTGAYMYVDYDESGSPGGGTLQKNPNYWNATALEAAGWYDADYLDFVTWPSSTLGTESRNTALMTNAIDYASDNFFTPVDYQDVLGESRLEYFELYTDDYISCITLNCINETFWSWPGYYENVETWYPTSYPAGNKPNGLPRALRKAMSYAFDYNTYINTGLNGRAVRGSAIGVSNIFYNSSVPIATHDLTIARNALLNDPGLGALCAAQGLDENSSTTEWRNAANSIGGKSPIWVLDFYWDDQNQVMKSVFQTSLENIGVSLKDETGATNKLPGSMWDEIGTYWVKGFPVFSAQAWPLAWNVPRTYGEGWIDASYHDPNDGSWRYPPYAISDYFPWFNLAFTYNETADYWLKRMWLSNDTARQVWLSKIADFAQNYQYDRIFISQGKEGAVHWKDWELSHFWGGITYPEMRYVGFSEEFPEIPGFLSTVIIFSSVLTLVGLIYVMRRKIRFI
jgi:ABC-type transport system substrate-binding protein